MINHVIFYSKIITSITNELRQNTSEIGGVLLGHIIDETCYVIETIPAGYNATQTWNSISFDHECLEYYANETAQLYATDLSLIGLWHSHPESDIEFSKSDLKTNTQYTLSAQTDIISAICFINNHGITSVKVYGVAKANQVNDISDHYEISSCTISDDIPSNLLQYKQYPVAFL